MTFLVPALIPYTGTVCTRLVAETEGVKDGPWRGRKAVLFCGHRVRTALLIIEEAACVPITQVGAQFYDFLVAKRRYFCFF